MNAVAGGPVNCSDLELSIYLAGLEAGYLPTYYSDISQSVQSKLTPIVSKSWRHGKKTGAFPGFPSLRMSRHSTAAHGAESLISSPADFPVKTSVQPAKAPESPGRGPACGQKWRELWVKFDPVSFGWKTHRHLWDEGLDWSCLTLPAWGMMQFGELWERTTQALRTDENESGYWRTPSASEMDGGAQPGSKRLADGHSMRLRDQVIDSKMWPTPRASEHSQHNSQDNGMALSAMVKMFPTPRASKSTNENEETWQKRKDAGKVSTPPLALAVRMFATPKSRDWKDQSQRGIYAPKDALPNMDNGDGHPIGGTLNPDWVELLMGWPLGWSDIDQPCKLEVRGWGEGWESGVPRVAKGVRNRTARLKAIGNGQVPVGMILAWEILSNE